MERRIFGIGLNKTGTRTFAACMRTLGYRHREHRPGSRRRMLEAWRRGDMTEIMWEAGNYDSFEDWPYPLIYKELFQHFGDRAKFVLTTRLTADHWLESLKKHSLTTSPQQHCRKLAYGYDFPHGHEQEHLVSYEAHKREVVDFFRSHHALDQLVELCWERGDSWSELCRFLDVPVPSSTFPKLNVAEKKRLAARPEDIAENMRLAGLDVDESNPDG